MATRKNLSSNDIERKALATFGRVKFDALINSFKHQSQMDDELRADRIEFVLRSNGLCPTLSEINDMKGCASKRGGSVDLHRFLDMALSCESLNNAGGFSEFMDFFSVYDPSNTGVIPESLFRRLMLDCGERFSEYEVNKIINAFSVRSRDGFIDYRAFITTLTGT